TPVTPVMPEVTSPPITPAGATEYTIAKGDTLDKIHNNLHVSVKAIIEANPGIEPKKLKVGQKIHIPAPTAPTTPTTPPAPAGIGAAPTDAPSVSGEQTYKVKSGDNLTKIATQHHVSLKALRAANGLKVDSIKVGQKLKIPAKSSAPTTAPVPPVESVPTTPSAR
ncbi:MAG: LysM peptidoglycan-binding domain-containing protein, partial [Verrucomicrobia bacterium]|nr:LysM peptidoglycan-binding domain-containing protein [Verrucomicrobiota bacterium]